VCIDGRAPLDAEATTNKEQTNMSNSIYPQISALAVGIGVFAIGAIPLGGFAQSQPQSQQTQPKPESGQQSQSAAQDKGAANAERPSDSQATQADSKAGGGQEKKSMGPNPYARMDDSWISISGTVNEIRPGSFELDFGERTISVEMDDTDRQSETYALRIGDKVTVNGMIDDDFFETSKIEASSVYVEKLGRYFFASALDEEDFHTVSYYAPIDGGVAVHGLVTEVDGDEFTIDTGLRSVRVDIGDMS
jgi:uncharacterized protein YdeI (BOF family)